MQNKEVLEELITEAVHVMAPEIFEALKKYSTEPRSAASIFYQNRLFDYRNYARRLIEAGWRPIAIDKQEES